MADYSLQYIDSKHLASNTIDGNNISSIEGASNSQNSPCEEPIRPSYSFILRKELPSYSSSEILSEEPPKYEEVTGEHLHNELDDVSCVTPESPPATTAPQQTFKIIKCIFLLASSMSTSFVFIILYWLLR